MFGVPDFILQIAGLVPFQNDGKGGLRHSWWAVGSGYLLATIFFGLTSWWWFIETVTSGSTLNLTKSSLTSLVVQCIEKVALLITSSLCLLMTTYHAKSILEVSDKFETDLSLKALGPFPKIRLRNVCLLSLYAILTVLEFLVPWSIYYKTIPLIYLRLLTFVTEITFSTAILCINDAFRQLNTELLSTLENRSVTARPVQILPYVDALKGLRNFRPLPHFNEIRDLSRTHWKLCSIAKDTNENYTVQLLVLFLTIFVRVISIPYKIFLTFEDTDVENNVIDITLNSLWVIAYILQLCLLVWPCSAVSNEAGETSTIIVHHLNKVIPANDRIQMEMFLVQLTNHQISFTACELFPIDLTVLPSLAGAVTTYLVILIQFQNSGTTEENT